MHLRLSIISYSIGEQQAAVGYTHLRNSTNCISFWHAIQRTDLDLCDLSKGITLGRMFCFGVSRKDLNVRLQCWEEVHCSVDCDTDNNWILKNCAESENMSW